MKARSVKRLAIGLGLALVLMMVAWFMLFVIYGWEVQAERLRWSMRWNADVPCIRAWMEERIANSPREPWEGAVVHVERRDWPRCIAELKPDFVDLVPEDGEVLLHWGTSEMSWGLAVARKGRKPPGDRLRKVEDGAWMWLRGGN